MKYLCLAYGDRKKMAALTKEQFEALKAKCQEHDTELRATGKVISAESLEWDAMTIRPTGGAPAVTDGPFVESKEQIGGVIIIEARDLNEAVRIASLHPAAHLGQHLGWAVEVRPYAATCHQ